MLAVVSIYFLRGFGTDTGKAPIWQTQLRNATIVL